MMLICYYLFRLVIEQVGIGIFDIVLRVILVIKLQMLCYSYMYVCNLSKICFVILGIILGFEENYFFRKKNCENQSKIRVLLLGFKG